MLDILKKSKESKAEREFIPTAHHILMRKYGWIPLDEFKQLPIPTLMSLLDLIEKEYQAEKKAYRRKK